MRACVFVCISVYKDYIKQYSSITNEIYLKASCHVRHFVVIKIEYTNVFSCLVARTAFFLDLIYNEERIKRFGFNPVLYGF